MPIFGALSMCALAAAVLFSFIGLGVRGGPGEHGFNSFTAWIAMSCYMFIPSVCLAVASVVRGEHPRWLGIVGLSFGGIPSLVGVYIFLGAPL